jgi:transcriptional regulator with XRE-family HTH domain
VAEGKTRPWEQGTDGGSFGAWLRRQREVREISLREIADMSKIPLRYLEALEQDRFEVLPDLVFTRGFLREYARFVGLDPDDVVNYFLSLQPEDEDEEPERVRPRPGRDGGVPALRIVAVAVVLVGALGVLLWWLAQAPAGKREVPPMAPPATVETTAPEPVPPTGLELPIRLTIDFDQKSWVEAFVDGARQVSELRVQGESLRLQANQEIRLVLSNANGVSLELNGQPYAPRMRDDEPLIVDLQTVGAAPNAGASALP